MTSRSAALPLALAVVALAAGAACGDPNTPRITALRYDGQAKDSPLVVLFSVDFEDQDGDLSAGRLEAFIDQSPVFTQPLELFPLFARAGLDEDATAGTFGFVLELSFAQGEPPPEGTKFSIGARVTDGAGRSSATEETRLQIEY